MSLLALGVLLTAVSFFAIGDTLLERYTNLILPRQSSEDVEHNLLITYGFALTQSWAWLAVPALVVVSREYADAKLCGMHVSQALVAAAVLGVSRRAIFIPFLLAYLTFVLFDGRWRTRWVLAAAIPILMLVGFGKEILASVASGGALEDVGGRYSTAAAAILRTALGRGVNVGRITGDPSLLDVDTQFGIDHLLSVLRKIPVSWFGWDPDFPRPVSCA